MVIYKDLQTLETFIQSLINYQQFTKIWQAFTKGSVSLHQIYGDLQGFTGFRNFWFVYI